MEGVSPRGVYVISIREEIPPKVAFGLGSALFGLFAQSPLCFAIGAAYGFFNGCADAIIHNRSSLTERVFRDRNVLQAMAVSGMNAEERVYFYVFSSTILSAIFSGTQYAVAYVMPEPVGGGLAFFNGCLVGKIVGEEFGLYVAHSRRHSHQQ